MGAHSISTVFFDVDTQIDFMFPSGSLYAPGAETILDAISKLNRYAAQNSIPLISTIDAHSEDDPEFKTWPHHCVVNTASQQKPVSTLLDRRIVVPNARCVFPLREAQQFLLEKQTFDCFTNVNLPSLLAQLNAERYVVYGVVTEVCVKYAAFGLLATGRRVELVTDAVRALNENDGAKMLAEFTAAGGWLTTVSQITGE
jgi:nicotinamidase/pyrazinamidase